MRDDPNAVIIRGYVLHRYLQEDRLEPLAYLGASALFLGMLFKIQHWPGAHVLIIAGIIAIVSSYLIHFVRKPVKSILAWFKAGYIVILAVAVYSVLFRLPYREELTSASSLSGLALVCLFYVHLAKKKKPAGSGLTAEEQQLFQYPEE